MAVKIKRCRECGRLPTDANYLITVDDRDVNTDRFLERWYVCRACWKELVEGQPEYNNIINLTGEELK